MSWLRDFWQNHGADLAPQVFHSSEFSMREFTKRTACEVAPLHLTYWEDWPTGLLLLGLQEDLTILWRYADVGPLDYGALVTGGTAEVLQGLSRHRSEDFIQAMRAEGLKLWPLFSELSTRNSIRGIVGLQELLTEWRIDPLEAALHEQALVTVLRSLAREVTLENLESELRERSRG